MSTNDQVTLLLAAGWPTILAVAELIKKKVPQVPNELTGFVAALLGVLWVLAVYAFKVPHPDWVHVALFAAIYGLSHSGAYEVLIKNLIAPFFAETPPITYDMKLPSPPSKEPQTISPVVSPVIQPDLTSKT